MRSRVLPFLASCGCLSMLCLGTCWSGEVPCPLSFGGLRVLDPGLDMYGSLIDVNGDGLLDVVGIKAIQGTSYLHVLLGGPNVTFTAQKGALLGPSWIGFSASGVCDFNGDSRLDVIVNGFREDPRFFLGNGDGTFKLGPAPDGLGDLRPTGPFHFNGDDKPDLLASDDGLRTAFPAIQREDYRFEVLASSPVSVLWLASQHLFADMNRDRLDDLLVIKDNGMKLYRNQGDGLYTEGIELPYPGFSARIMDIFDASGDSLPDILMGETGPDRLFLILALGNDRYAEATVLDLGTTAGGNSHADVDEDGKVDIILGSKEGILILPGCGGGEFGGPEVLPAPVQLSWPRVHDFDGDGIFDVAAYAGDVHASLSFFLSTERSRFQTVLRNLNYPSDAIAEDFDRDGRRDLMVAQEGAEELVLYRGSPDGFSAPETLPAGGHVTSLAAADFSGDGFPDFAASATGENKVLLFVNDGRGGFATPEVISSKDPGGLAIVDLDGDGSIDLAVADAYGRKMRIHYGLGGGLFEEPSSSVPTCCPHLKVRDVDGDRRPDLLCPGGCETGFHVLFNAGNRKFRGSYLPHDVTADAVYGMDAADFNGDGVLEPVAALSGAVGSISFYQGSGGGSFKLVRAMPYSLHPDFKGALDVATGDLNGDSLPDVAAVQAQAYVTVFQGTPQGDFEPVSYWSVWSTDRVILADLDGDSRDDIIALANDSVTLMGNRASCAPRRLGDTDGNGRIEVTDCLTILLYLFRGEALDCLAAADWNRSGDLNVADPVGILMWLFAGAPSSPVTVGCPS